jgi:hypothetical protein
MNRPGEVEGAALTALQEFRDLGCPILSGPDAIDDHLQGWQPAYAPAGSCFACFESYKSFSHNFHVLFMSIGIHAWCMLCFILNHTILRSGALALRGQKLLSFSPFQKFSCLLPQRLQIGQTIVSFQIKDGCPLGLGYAPEFQIEQSKEVPVKHSIWKTWFLMLISSVNFLYRNRRA